MAMLKREQTDVERHGSEVLDALNMLKISEPQPVPTWYIGLIDELTTAIVFLLSAKMVEYDSPESRIKPVQTVVNAAVTDGMALVALAGVPTSLLPDFATTALRTCLTDAEITERQTQYLHRIRNCVAICCDMFTTAQANIAAAYDVMQLIAMNPIVTTDFEEKLEDAAWKRKRNRMMNARRIPFYYGENMDINQSMRIVIATPCTTEADIEKVYEAADNLGYIIALMGITIERMKNVLMTLNCTS